MCGVRCGVRCGVWCDVRCGIGCGVGAGTSLAPGRRRMAQDGSLQDANGRERVFNPCGTLSTAQSGHEAPIVSQIGVAAIECMPVSWSMEE